VETATIITTAHWSYYRGGQFI